MMRLPARVTAKLAKARIVQVLRSEPPSSLIYFVDPAEVLHPGSVMPVSCEKMQRLIENPAPVIWIGGTEPLVHPGIGHFVCAIAQSGHVVFLETDGTFLRRRIHEFPPLPQLFLTVRLDSPQAPESALAVEGLRAARLAGFFTVVHALVREDSDLARLNALRSFLLEKDVDGWLITSQSAGQATARKAAEARGLMPGGFWRKFSEQLEKAFLTQAQARELHGVSVPLAESPHTEAREETVRVA